MTNLILCGGSGTRLWPISRTLMPKQFVKLFEGKSLFQITVERNQKYCVSQYIVSNAEQYFLALDQLEEFDLFKGVANTIPFLIEPVGRNTAPAIALACMVMEPDTVLLVTPSDHLIKDEKAYFKAIEEAKSLAEAGHLVTFGIRPEYPETGFGYIQADGNEVISFKEKPDLVTAQKYLEKNAAFSAQNSTLFLWNSGMFCFKANVFLEELQRHAPDTYEACKTALKHASEYNSDNLLRIPYEAMMAIPDESIDYAVMEKSNNVKVVPCDIGWSDLGSFDALYEELPKDENDNTENEKLITVDSKDNLVLGDERTIALIDIENLIVVDTGDALLISKKGSSQKVKKVVEALKQKGSELPQIHLTVYRPWGTYTVLEKTSGYKIKRIVVKPGKRLSLQKHFHRSEHWIVVSGTATVTVGKEKYLVRPNESTYIKRGEIHRLENEGKIPVVMIEAQVGEYTGEDDIVRIEDDFQRV